MAAHLFSLNPVDEIRLENAPLARVLTQVRYSRTPRLVSDDGENRLAELLGRYPIRRRGTQHVLALQIGPQGAVQLPAQTGGQAVTFSEPENAWKTTISDSSLSLETTKYDSRNDFCERLHEVLSAIQAVELPPIVDRIGVRYIDRLEGPALDRVGDYVHPGLRALFGYVDPPLEVTRSVTQSQIMLNEYAVMTVNTGLHPPNTVMDPAIPPLAARSWVLDIDVATRHGGHVFDPEALTATVREFAEHAHAFFRFATTESFLRDFGGDV